MSCEGRASLFLRALLGGFGPRHVDLLRSFRNLRQHRHAVGQHFDKAAGDREIVLLLPNPIPELPDFEHCEQRRVAGQDAKYPSDPGS